jgi:drug/metabolite transporter (DMT)-like permease
VNDAVAAKPPPAWALALGFGTIYLAWGTTFYAIKLGVQDEHLPPLLFGGLRIAAAGAMLLGYQWLAGATVWLSRHDAFRLFAVGFLLFVAGNGLIGYGQKTLESSVAAALVATTPLWIGLTATAFSRHERLTLRGWTGLLFGLGGVVTVLAPKLAHAQQPFDALGAVFVLGSAASWALGSVLLRHVRIDQPHLTVAGYQMFLGGGSMLLAALALDERSALPAELTLNAVLVLLYLMLVGSLAGFVAFNWLLGHVSATKVGTYAYVNPVIAVLIGWGFGEDVTWELWLGMGVVLFGVFLVRGGERRRSP